MPCFSIYSAQYARASGSVRLVGKAVAIHARHPESHHARSEQRASAAPLLRNAGPPCLASVLRELDLKPSTSDVPLDVDVRVSFHAHR